VVFDDLHYRFRPYDQWTSYGQSKSAIVLFAVAAAQRWADDGIAVNALMPGNIASTALMRHLGPDDLANLGKATDVARYFQDLWMGLFRRPPFRLIRPARRA